MGGKGTSLTTAFHLQLATQTLPDYHLLPHQQLHPPSHHCNIRLSQHPFSRSIILPDTLMFTQPHTPHHHHKYKDTRERGILQRLSDCHQPAVCLKVGRLLGGPYTHLQQSPVNFYTAAASSCNFTHTRMHKKSPKPTHHHDDISSSSLNAQDTCMHVLCVKRMH